MSISLGLIVVRTFTLNYFQEKTKFKRCFVCTKYILMTIYTKSGERTLAVKYLPLLTEEDFPGRCRESEQDLPCRGFFHFQEPTAALANASLNIDISSSHAFTSLYVTLQAL